MAESILDVAHVDLERADIVLELGHVRTENAEPGGRLVVQALQGLALGVQGLALALQGLAEDTELRPQILEQNGDSVILHEHLTLPTAAGLGKRWRTLVRGPEPMRARVPATILLCTGVGLTAYTALQCVPMPIGLLAVIAPHNAEVWSRVLLPLGEAGPRWAPITLDPIATRVEVLEGVPSGRASFGAAVQS